MILRLFTCAHSTVKPAISNPQGKRDKKKTGDSKQLKKTGGERGLSFK